MSDEWEAVNESFTFCRSPVLEHSEHLSGRALKEVYFIVTEYIVLYVYMQSVDLLIACICNMMFLKVARLFRNMWSDVSL